MQPLSSGFRKFLQKIGEDSHLSLLFLRELWPRLVGSEVAKSATPVDLKGKRLVVQVCDSVWKKELSRLQAQVIASVNHFWGCELVERLTIRVEKKNEAEKN